MRDPDQGPTNSEIQLGGFVIGLQFEREADGPRPWASAVGTQTPCWVSRYDGQIDLVEGTALPQMLHAEVKLVLPKRLSPYHKMPR